MSGHARAGVRTYSGSVSPTVPRRTIAQSPVHSGGKDVDTLPDRLAYVFTY
jgi:hypothetical protein